MSEELKPCPFCGGNVNLAINGIIKHTCHGYGDAWCNTDKWNTRPIEDGLRAELARCDEIIKRLKEDGERLVIYYVGDSDHEHDDRIL